MSSESETNSGFFVLRTAYRREVSAWLLLAVVFVYFLFAGFVHPAFSGFVLMFIGLRLSILVVVYRALPVGGAAVAEDSERQQSGALLLHEAKRLRLVVLWYLFPFLVGLWVLLMAYVSPRSQPGAVASAVLTIILSVLATVLGIRAASRLKREAELLRHRELTTG
jgi:hypothetical protein